VYPTNQYYAAKSETKNRQAPEIIMTADEVAKQCEIGEACGVIVGVVGTTPGQASSFRITGFYEANHLDEFHSYEKSAKNEEGLDIHWFIILDGVTHPSKYFDYVVTVSSPDGGDPDLYITLMDGRSPTTDDFDLKSNLKGADSIRITSEDSIWQRMNWDKSAGIMVVCGVKATSNYRI